MENSDARGLPVALSSELIGAYRRIGKIGPVYQVIGPSDDMDGKPSIRIVLVETGEETTYPITEMMSDPVPD